MSFPLALTPAIKETNPMAKADPNSTTNTSIFDATSRRNFLTSAAGVAAGATAAVPALALPVDPIFAAIENHKKRNRAWFDLEQAAEARPRSVKRSDVSRVSVAATQAAWRMARTRPTTVAGAAAMLAYIAPTRSPVSSN